LKEEAMSEAGKARAGFTLIEILAALALVSSIVVGASALLHHVVRYYDHGTRGVDEAERFALAMERLSRDFSAARFVAATPKGPIAFDGEREKIVFVSGSAVGARAMIEEVLTFSTEPAGEGTTALMRRRAAWPGSRAGLYRETARDPVALLRGRYEISFSYARLDANGGLSWSDKWKDRDELPRLVRLSLRDSETGANLVAGAEFLVFADAPAACAPPAENCGRREKPNPGESARPTPREPT
jgi:prepilin-type N-terminal cleavage/methylation domain-containing protein